MQKMDGMNYAPISQGKVRVVCQPGEFKFAVIGLDHGHIFAMCNGLLEAGATLVSVYDADAAKIKAFSERYPAVRVASSAQEILADKSIQLVASAIVPCERFALGVQVMQSGKDYFVDKPGMLKAQEVQIVEQLCASTGKKYTIYFGERLHVEGAVYAQQLIEQGAIGRVLQVTILAPHRLNRAVRPSWFFEKEQNGGIITDIGSHQIEQFLAFSGASSAQVMHSAVANYANCDKENFYDFGEANLLADNGASCYFRVDWFTPSGLSAWGDGRVFIMGTQGTIEIRKYLDVGVSTIGDQVILVDAHGEHKSCVTGQMSFVFFGEFILDCLHRTENAITQRHTLQAMKIAIEAQEKARVLVK